MSTFDFVIFALATYRVTRLLIRDEILREYRDKFFDKYPPETSKLGYLATCQWCLSIWVGLTFISWYTINSDIARFFGIAFALSALAGLLTAYEDRD